MSKSGYNQELNTLIEGQPYFQVIPSSCLPPSRSSGFNFQDIRVWRFGGWRIIGAIFKIIVE